MIPMGNESDVAEYRQAYLEIASYIGVRLAENELGHSQDKCFGVSNEGSLLGIFFNSVDWTYKIPPNKTKVMLHQIKDLLGGEMASVKTLRSIIGRVTHYMEVVPGGRWERSFLLMLVGEEDRDDKEVQLNWIARQQLRWWFAAVKAGRGGHTIKRRALWRKSYAVEVYSDASGGTIEGNKGGYGGIIFLEGRPGVWIENRWPLWLNSGLTNRLGIRFNLKLSTLEGVAGVAMIASAAKELMGHDVIWFCDNQGVVEGWKKGQSSDIWLSIILKALHDLCRGCGIRLEVRWSPRMVGPGPRAADALSKADMARAAEDWGTVEELPRQVPQTLVKWVREPKLTRTLGARILRELKTNGVDCEMLEEVDVKPSEEEMKKMNRWYRLKIRRDGKKVKAKEASGGELEETEGREKEKKGEDGKRKREDGEGGKKKKRRKRSKKTKSKLGDAAF